MDTVGRATFFEYVFGKYELRTDSDRDEIIKVGLICVVALWRFQQRYFNIAFYKAPIFTLNLLFVILSLDSVRYYIIIWKLIIYWFKIVTAVFCIKK